MLLYQNLGTEENGDLTMGLIVMESSLSYHWKHWQNLRRVGKDILKGIIKKMGPVSWFTKDSKKIRTNIAASTRWVAQRRVQRRTDVRSLRGTDNIVIYEISSTQTGRWWWQRSPGHCWRRIRSNPWFCGLVIFRWPGWHRERWETGRAGGGILYHWRASLYMVICW